MLTGAGSAVASTCEYSTLHSPWHSIHSWILHNQGLRKGILRRNWGRFINRGAGRAGSPSCPPSHAVEPHFLPMCFILPPTALGNLLDAEGSVTHTKGRAVPTPARTSLTPWGTEPGSIPLCRAHRDCADAPPAEARRHLAAAHCRVPAPTCTCTGWAGPLGTTIPAQAGRTFPGTGFLPKELADLGTL